jgi:hypothetical protein
MKHGYPQLGRLALGIMFALSVCLLTLPLRADDPPDQPGPPVRLKKKSKPQAEEPAVETEAGKKPKSLEDELRPKKVPDKIRIPGKNDKDEKPDEDLKEPEQDPKEIMARITKNMRMVDERLAMKDAGAGTRQVQRDILKDLDALIEQKRRQQQQQRASQSSRNQQRQQRAQRQRELQEQAEAQKQQENDQMTKTGTGGGRGGGRGGKIADLYKDIWGHLPETLRQEMDAYSREKFMAKYGDLLKQYYSTISEKGRGKGD